MTALRKPSPYAGLEEFEYDIGDVRVTCWLDYEKEEKQTRDEPGYPANATVHYVLHCGEDIAKILSDEQKEAIEIAFLEQEPEY